MELVGQILKKRREIKGLSLKDISDELMISEDILNNIENNIVTENIDIVFILGQFRSYCLYLDLDHHDLIKQFKKENLPTKLKDFEIVRPTTEKNFLFSNKAFSTSIIIVIFSTFYFLFIENDDLSRDYAIIPDLPENYISIIEKANLDNSKAVRIKNQNIENIILTQNSLSSSSVIASLPKLSKNDTVLITLKILDATWVQIRDVNNEIVMSQLMNQNDEYSYDSILRYSVTSGNAGHILVLVNQEVRGKVGKKGQVVDSLVLDTNFNN